ncbi:hypothetical protein T11_11335 [Trichinella zimbabwensis]|uniref:Uncharacterized protein n=1 Tax=Trichinella zimbabwensis TaxID=268475 RepID=A0A0V1HLS7_9BILA|nr:hypothetical protein T11_11335 [Trichinella zimbabwensis]
MATGVHTASVRTWPAKLPSKLVERSKDSTKVGQSTSQGTRTSRTAIMFRLLHSQRPLTYMSTMFQDTDYPA